jgi:hypothetical protein
MNGSTLMHQSARDTLTKAGAGATSLSGRPTDGIQVPTHGIQLLIQILIQIPIQLPVEPGNEAHLAPCPIGADPASARAETPLG